MEIDSYANLKTAILDTADLVNNQKFTDYLDVFIRATESKVRKRLRIGQQEQTAELDTSEGVYAYSLPDRFQSFRVVTYYGPDSDSGVVLGYMDPLTMARMRDGYSEVKFHTRVNQQMHLLAAPANGGKVEIVYREGIEPLSSDVPSNWLLEDYPEVYLYGSLSEALKMKKFAGTLDSAMFDIWRSEFGEELAALESADAMDNYEQGLQREYNTIGW